VVAPFCSTRCVAEHGRTALTTQLSGTTVIAQLSRTDKVVQLDRYLQGRHLGVGDHVPTQLLVLSASY
jgi:hypothetical protein